MSSTEWEHDIHHVHDLYIRSSSIADQSSDSLEYLELLELQVLHLDTNTFRREEQEPSVLRCVREEFHGQYSVLKDRLGATTLCHHGLLNLDQVDQQNAQHHGY